MWGIFEDGTATRLARRMERKTQRMERAKKSTEKTEKTGSERRKGRRMGEDRET